MTVKKFHIKKISEIDKKQLTDFYQNSFNYQKTLLNNYNWRYRNRYNEHEPIVLIMDNQICGHAGLIPINFKIFKEQIKAIWFTDFFVIPKFRSLGFGKILTVEWMKICSTQITICTITEKNCNYAKAIDKSLKDAGIRTELDNRNEKIGYKIREHSDKKVPIILVVGDKENSTESVSIRRLGNKDFEQMKFNKFMKLFREELEIK